MPVRRYLQRFDRLCLPARGDVGEHAAGSLGFSDGISEGRRRIASALGCENRRRGSGYRFSLSAASPGSGFGVLAQLDHAGGINGSMGGLLREVSGRGFGSSSLAWRVIRVLNAAITRWHAYIPFCRRAWRTSLHSRWRLAVSLYAAHATLSATRRLRGRASVAASHLCLAVAWRRSGSADRRRVRVRSSRSLNGIAAHRSAGSPGAACGHMAAASCLDNVAASLTTVFSCCGVPRQPALHLGFLPFCAGRMVRISAAARLAALSACAHRGKRLAGFSACLWQFSAPGSALLVASPVPRGAARRWRGRRQV